MPTPYDKDIAELRALIPADARADVAPIVTAIRLALPDVAPEVIARCVFTVCGMAAQATGETAPKGTLAFALFFASELVEPGLVEPADAAATSRLRQWRTKSGLTLDEMADLTGVHKSVLSRLERGQRKLLPMTKAMMARRLGARISDLFEVEGDAACDSVAADEAGDEPLIDPDCRGGKCASCVGGPCQHACHTEAANRG